MKICFTGAQSTGKSTLVEELRKDPEFARFKVFTNITRDVNAKGYPINEHATNDTQEQIMLEHRRRLSFAGDAIYDRCSLDVAIYTHHYLLNNQVSFYLFKEIKEAFVETIGKYDVIFYTGADIPLKSDGVRSKDPFFRQRIVDLFERYIKDYNLPVVRLEGSVEQRLAKIKEALRGKI